MVVPGKRVLLLQHWLSIQPSYCLRALMVVEVRLRQRMWFVWIGHVGTVLTGYEGTVWVLLVGTCVVVAWVDQTKMNAQVTPESQWDKSLHMKSQD